MINWREYNIAVRSYDGSRYIYHDMRGCMDTSSGNPRSMQEFINWALDHEERIHNAHGGE